MAQAEATADTAVVKKGGKMTIIIAAVAAMGIGMGATWFLLGGKNDSNHGEPKPVKEMPVVFFPLQTFTVNLIPEFGDQYLQVEISLKLSSQSDIDDIKVRMPEVRNGVLFLLSSKRASELTTIDGKGALASGIRDSINSLIDPGYVAEPMKPLQRQDVSAGDHVAAADGNAVDAVPTVAHPTDNPKQSGPVREVLFTSFIIQ